MDENLRSCALQCSKLQEQMQARSAASVQSTPAADAVDWGALLKRLACEAGGLRAAAAVMSELPLLQLPAWVAGWLRVIAGGCRSAAHEWFAVF